MDNLKKKLNIKYYLWIAIISFFVVFLNSMASPIFDISLLNDDAHLFYVIGRGIKYGKIPYIDLFDHKGLYIFFIAFLGSIIEFNHIGLFLIVYIFTLVNGIFAYKVSKFFLDDIGSLFVSTIMVVLQNSNYFSMGAFECETFLLTFIMISFYLFLKYLNKISNANIDFSHNCYFMLIQGILAGIVLMMKPNICILWGIIGIIILVVLIKQKLYKNLVLNIIFGLCGVIIAILPCLIYCLLNNCLYEMIDATFIFNMKYMSKSVHDYGGLGEHIILWLYNFWGVFICLVLSLIVVVKCKLLHKIFKVSFICFLLASLFTILISNRPYTYYANILIPFFIPIICYIYIKIKKLLKSDITNKIIFISIICIVCVSSLIFGKNMNYNSQKHLLSCANVIRENYKKNFKNKKNVEVFGIGDSAFVFDALNVLPEERYFFTPKILYEDKKDVYDEIYDYLNSKKSDYVVVCLNDILVINKEITKKYFDVLDKKYKLISNELGLYIYKKK